MFRSEADIVGMAPIDAYIVAGWFTECPVYRPLAERFAANLDDHSIPFHLYAKPRLSNGWDTRRKPTVALEALDAYPGKTIILMDVDCRVYGDITPLHDVPGDIGLTIRARPLMRRGQPRPRQAVVRVSSRVVVFRPFAGAVAFAKEWQRLCALTGPGGDEGRILVRPEQP